MRTLDDAGLVSAYATQRSEEAFATLVERHVSLVYSSALRQVRDPHLAEEITQTVFIILARKAGSLGRETVLAGWLCRTAHFAACNALKAAHRRQFREQEAHMNSPLNEPEPDVWPQVAPLLDEAVAQLSEADRNAVVLRFYEQRPLEEVGRALGLSADAAQKRVSRALEKLRKFFLQRGVASTTTIIAGAITTHSVQAAPVALAKSVTAAAVVKGAAGSSTLTLVKGALKIMAWTKTKTTVVAGVVLLLAAGTTTVMVNYSGHHRHAKLPLTPANEEAFKGETSRLINQSKQLALAFHIYAGDHNNQFPKDFAQVKTYLQGNLSDSNWEIVSGGKRNKLADLSHTILLREKESRQSPDGKFYKIYALADGSVQVTSSADDDFGAVEKRWGFVTHPAKN